MSVSVRPATEADCRGMPAFRREMEGGAFLESLRDEAYYRHKYLEFGTAFVIAEGERILGVTSATPKRIRLPGGIVSAGEVGDLFVRPDFRGRGLFRALHDAVVGSLREQGVVLATVRAGRGASAHMQKAFGYRRLHRVAESVAALTPAGRARLPMGRVPLVRRLLPRVRFHTPEVPGGSAEVVPVADLPAETSESRVGTVRYAERIRLRYAAGPVPYEGIALSLNGRPAGGAVTLVSGGKGFLVDLWADTDDRAAADLLVSSALRSLAANGADVVHFWRAA
ncbi:MAG: GNAT family N-acetyltransferase, partial [Planctomycetota bacterium]